MIWDNIKHNNIHIIGLLGGEKRKQGTEILFEEITTEIISLTW